MKQTNLSFASFLSSINNSSGQRLVTIYTLVMLVSLIWPNPLSLLLILIFPATLLFKITKTNLALLAPIILLINIAILILSAVLLEVVGLKVSFTSLLVINLVVTAGLFSLIKFNKLKPLNQASRLNKATLIVYGLFTIALLGRFFAVIDLPAPLTHDPISHAYWAKLITEIGHINYFYPPGLHVLIGVVAETLNLTYAQSTHYVSNFLNALSVLTWSILAYIVTRSRLFTVITAALMLIVPLPTILAYVAGKNAYIASFALMPVVFLCLYWFIKKQSWITWILLIISSLGLFFVYYPSFGYTGVFAAIVLIASLIVARRNQINWRPYLAKIIYLLVALVIVCGGWLVYTYEAYEERSEGVVVLNGSAESQIEPDEGETNISIDNALNQTQTTVMRFKLVSDSYDNFYFPIAALSLLAISVVYRKQLNYLTIIALAISVFIIPLFINIFEIPGMNIISTAGEYLFFQVFVLASAATAVFVLKKSRLNSTAIALVLLVLFVVSSWIAYQHALNYRSNASRHALVNGYDMEAYSWINQNLDKETLFLNDARQHSRRQRIIFPMGGSAWIPVYTDGLITMPFQEERFSSNETHENYATYLNLNGDARSSICTLNNRGVSHYYHNLKTTNTPPIDITNTGTAEYLQLVYKNNGVNIYEIIANC